MASDPKKLAQALHDAQGQSGKITDEQKGFAEAFLNYLKTAMIVTFLPDTVTGVCPSGGPLQVGAATAGMISGLAAPALATALAKEMGKKKVTSQLLGYASSIVTHISSGTVTFKSGDITGACSNSPSSPGAVLGQGKGGRIVGLSPKVLASLAAKGLGKTNVSKPLEKSCAALVDHLQQQAEILLPPTSVKGVAPSGGGPMTKGSAAGGKFT